MSIDTEGSEVRILEAFDFARFQVASICVEHNQHNRDALLSILGAHGYRRKWPEVSGHDDWYVHDQLLPEWDLGSVDPLLARMATVEPFTVGFDERLRCLRELGVQVTEGVAAGTLS
jgi:hypothetical protein